MPEQKLTLVTFPNHHSNTQSWTGTVAEDMVKVGRDGLTIYPDHYVSLPVEGHEVIAGYDSEGNVRIIWEIDAQS